MTDQGAASAAEARRDPAQLRIERDTRLVLRGLGYCVAALCLGVVWVYYFILVQLGGPDTSRAATSGIAAGLGLSILVVAVLRRRASVSRLITFVALSGLYLGLLANTPDHNASITRTRFYATYRSIQVGMSTAEVQAAIDAQFPDGKPMIRFHPAGCFVGPLDPNDGRYNAEFFELAFRNGVVASKRYLPD